MPMQYPSPRTRLRAFRARDVGSFRHHHRLGEFQWYAVIGIHGPITSYDDSLIGTTGAAISHGCIRLHDADLAQLSIIPAGTPIDIVSS